MKIKDLPKEYRSRAKSMFEQIKDDPDTIIVFYKSTNEDALSYAHKEEYKMIKNHQDVEIVEMKGVKRTRFKEVYNKRMV